MIADLRPAALDEIGPEAALVSLAERVRGRHGLEVSLDVDLDFEQGRAATRHVPELEEATYRIVQEALTNTIKHGEATSVSVTVHEANSALAITVRDDGRGFDRSARAAGFGLLGMRERVALLEGQLTVQSAPGEGTAIAVTFPVRRRPAGSEAGTGAVAS